MSASSGRDGGFTARVADAVVIVPTVNPERVTPHTEAFQAVVWHLLVSHPALQQVPTTWEIELVGARVVFLDRDGVINRAFLRDGVPHPPATLEALEILPGVPDALARLAHGRVPADRGDQSAGRGARHASSRAGRSHEHARCSSILPLDEIRVCYHDDADGCMCRKPKPALLTQGPPVDFAASVMVGDRWRDIEAGRAAGCATVLVDSWP